MIKTVFSIRNKSSSRSGIHPKPYNCASVNRFNLSVMDTGNSEIISLFGGIFFSMLVYPKRKPIKNHFQPFYKIRYHDTET